MTKPNILDSGILLIAGGIGLIIGVMTLFMPDIFHESAGIILGDNASLRSEMRAPGALLLVLSIFMVWSGATRKRQSQALTLACVVYLSYGIARIYSWGVDGAPASSLVIAMVVELLVGAAAAYALLRGSKSSVSGR